MQLMIILVKSILNFVLRCMDDILVRLENSFIGNLLCGITFVTFRSRLQTLQVAAKKVKIHCTDGFRNDSKVERRRIYKGASINNVINFFSLFEDGSSILHVTTFLLFEIFSFSSIFEPPPTQKKIRGGPKSRSSLVIHPVGLRVSVIELTCSQFHILGHFSLISTLDTVFALDTTS